MNFNDSLSDCSRYGSSETDTGGISTTDAPPTAENTNSTTANNTSSPSYNASLVASIPFPAPIGLTSDSTITVFNLTQDSGTSDNGSLPTSSLFNFTTVTEDPQGTQAFNSCTRISGLGRFARSAFDVQYSLRLGSVPFPNQLLIPSDKPLVLAFTVKPLQDNGGTLKYQLDLLTHRIVVRIDILMQNYI